ncbi:helix-turn-helix transcriptional regulator [Streptomyces sp. HPF1205]|uniref:helix-turn-helix domain-containing protein n=1 Tax=Streptomyces sp. HPF1205 TaxID=2873262 RepID=UPI001CEE0349|nr:helix-turn-helix transcriptional regulator [Streptomyces sp. HPF1205]
MGTDDAQPRMSWLTYYGEELQQARERRGLSVRELAAQTSYSFQQLYNVEAGRRTPSEAFTREVDQALETGGQFERILSRVHMEAFPAWWQGAAREEARATRICTYQSQVVHGLLQTEDYARALMREARPRESAERIEADVAARRNRQSILTRAAPPLFWTVLDEAVLKRPIGGKAVMLGQLEHLLDMAEHKNVVIQVLPFATGAHAATDGSFTLWSYADRDDVLYVEALFTGNIVQRQADVESTRVAYDLLVAAALPRDRSLDLIRSALKDLAT